MRVDEIMSRHVHHVDLDATLETIRRIFEESRFHHLVVLEEGRLVGIVSDRDLLRNLSPWLGTPSERTMDTSSLKRKAHQVMTRAVVTGSAEMDVAEAARVMLVKRVSCLPVVDAWMNVVGIVTDHDILKWTVQQFCGSDPNSVCHTPDRRAA
ncbi:MAG: CBS domain-containing protein [Phycisphaerae bacterium]|nr:CBS domain-containing protein [Phycisphaerae bacterium]